LYEIAIIRNEISRELLFIGIGFSFNTNILIVVPEAMNDNSKSRRDE